MVNPELAQKYANIAEMDMSVHDFKGAEENIDKAINLNFRNMDYHLLKADILVNQSRFSESIKVLDFAENLDSGDPAVHSMKSICYSCMEDYQKSKIEAEKAIKLDPEYAYAYFNLGNALKFLGDVDASIKVYRKYENMQPDDPEGHLELADIYFGNREYKKALQEINIVTRFNKNNMEAHDMKLEILLEQRDMEAYLNELNIAFTVSKEFKYIKQTANIFRAMNSIDAAIDILNEYIARDIDSVPAYRELANLYIEQDNDELAYSIFEKALSLDNSDKNKHYWLYFLLDNEKYNKLMDEINKIGINDNTTMEIKYMAFNNMGNHESALEVLKNLLKDQDSDHYAALYAGQLRKLKRNDEAIDFLAKYQDTPETEYEKFLLLVDKKNIGQSMELLARIARDRKYPDEFDIANGILTLIENTDLETVDNFLKKIISEQTVYQKIIGVMRGINYGVNSDYETGKTMILEMKDKNMDTDVCYYLYDLEDTENEKCSGFIGRLIEEHCSGDGNS